MVLLKKTICFGLFLFLVSACAPSNTANQVVTTNAAVQEDLEKTPIKRPVVFSEYVPPKNGFGDYLAGRHARAVNDLESAAKYYFSALKKNPGNASLLRRSYILKAANGEIKEAADLARRALMRRGAGQALPIIIITVEAAWENNFKVARERLEPLKPYGFGRYLLPLMTARLSVGDGDTDNALEKLKQLQDMPELKSLYHFHAGLINDLADRKEEAEKNYEITLKTPGGLSLRAVQVIGNFFRRNGELEKASFIVKQYQALHPSSLAMEEIARRFAKQEIRQRPVNSAKDGMAEALFGLAATMSQNREYDSGLLFSNLSLVLDPDFDLALILLGDILEVLDRSEEAIKVYKSIPKDSDVYFPAMLRVAVNLEKLEDIDGAVAMFRNLAAERPSQYGPLRDLGDVLRVNKRYAEAAEAYNQALARVGKIETYHWPLLYTLGIAQERAGNWPEAEKALLKALQLAPEHPLLLNYLGYSWLQQDMNVDRAIDMITRAVKQRPADGYIIDSLGWALYRKGLFDKAVLLLGRAIELEPGNAVINDHLGDAYWRVGRKKEAFFQWERALSLSKESELEDEAATRKKALEGLGPITDEMRKNFFKPEETKNIATEVYPLVDDEADAQDVKPEEKTEKSLKDKEEKPAEDKKKEDNKTPSKKEKSSKKKAPVKKDKTPLKKKSPAEKDKKDK